MRVIARSCGISNIEEAKRLFFKAKDEHERKEKSNEKESNYFAEIICVPENGVLEYFLSALDKKERYTKETIEDVLCALREAEDAINSLQVAE